MTAGFLLLNPPMVENWQIITDGTERGGESVGFVSEIESTPESTPESFIRKGILFQGSLGGIPGADGLVGFALTRVAWAHEPAETASYLGLRLVLDEVSDELTYSLLLRTENLEIPGIPGQVTFQKTFTGDEREVSAKWSDFRAVVRGRELDPEIAPVLDPTKITDWAVQITRSKQSAANRVLVPLSFRIGFRR